MVLNHISVGKHQCVFYTHSAPSDAWISFLPAQPIFQCWLPFSALACEFPTNGGHVRTPSRSFASSCGLHSRERRLLIPSALTPCFVLGLKTIPKTTPRPRPTKRNVTAEYGSIHFFPFSLLHLSQVSLHILNSYEHSYERRSSILFLCPQKPCHFTKALFCC